MTEELDDRGLGEAGSIGFIMISSELLRRDIPRKGMFEIEGNDRNELEIRMDKNSWRIELEMRRSIRLCMQTFSKNR